MTANTIEDGSSAAESGSGPAVLLLHSLALSAEAWDPIAVRLSGFRTIRPDFRGHGRSHFDGESFSVDDLADDVVATMDSIGVSSASVIGVSLGGSVAMSLAIRHPERVENLVLADCTACYGDNSAQAWKERAETVLSVPREQQYEVTKTRWFSDAYVEANGEEVERLGRIFIACDGAAHAAASLALGAMDLRSQISSIAAPTLVVIGENDMGTPLAMSQFTQQQINGSRLVVVRGVRHMAVFESPAIWDEISTHLATRG